MKKHLIYWLPAIPLVGIVPMILYDAFNDETSARLCIKKSDNTVACFIIQMWSVIILLMELNIILP